MELKLKLHDFEWWFSKSRQIPIHFTCPFCREDIKVNISAHSVEPDSRICPLCQLEYKLCFDYCCPCSEGLDCLSSPTVEFIFVDSAFVQDSSSLWENTSTGHGKRNRRCK